jgi:hypothetical protein
MRRETRHSAGTGIYYGRHACGWQHYDHSGDGDRGLGVGPIYKTKLELLADHESYMIRGGWILETGSN